MEGKTAGTRAAIRAKATLKAGPRMGAQKGAEKIGAGELLLSVGAFGGVSASLSSTGLTGGGF